MKKFSLVMVLAIALVLSFSVVAMAKYAGYAYNTPLAGETAQNPAVGYLSWDGAKELMAANGVATALQASPHGGYTTSTTKCAVCHSTHRAATDLDAAGVGSYWKLTPGGSSCTACHTPHGANPVPSALVEWPAVYADGGPHNRQNCLGACHASVHGGGSSEYGTLQAFNLTGANDPAIAAALTAGNTWTAAQGLAKDAANGGGRGEVTEATLRDFAASMENTPKKATTQRALKAMATGYTCGAAGCHSSSQFSVNAEGYAEPRAGDPRDSRDLNALFTGHLTNMTYGCPPCHMNDMAYYTWNLPDLGRESDCGLCHDMIGKATGSTAFPHANRNIVVYEYDGTTDANGLVATEKNVTSGNLWMYAGDATRRDADGNPSPTGTMAQRARTVIEGAAGFDVAGNLPGNNVDGACLKCHAFAFGGAHLPGGWPTQGSYNKADGTPTGNVLDFSKF